MDILNLPNPIYDTVFKYLMDDMEIAKGLLSAILDTEIVELNVQPQETVVESADQVMSLRIFRIDFGAVIRQKDGSLKKILIELQKSRHSTNPLRFRRYLAENYQKEDTILVDGQETKQVLEIVTIYILGFNLENVPPAVLKIKNCFVDVATGQTIEEASKEEFVRLLNHESYVIQVQKIHDEARSRLEALLSIFSQKASNLGAHFISFDKETNDPLLQRMVQRLLRATASEEMRRKLNLEEEFERAYKDMEESVEEKQRNLESVALKLAEKNQEIKDKDKALEDKDKALEDKDRFIEELLKQLGK